ncbi:hypothetical protein PPAR_a2966 [Pseudoalteromonas paragorgicola KMM 3548]|nr:hypothetical protein [Pseudoalteromonas distincta KMM 3548]
MGKSFKNKLIFIIHFLPLSIIGVLCKLRLVQSLGLLHYSINAILL